MPNDGENGICNNHKHQRKLQSLSERRVNIWDEEVWDKKEIKDIRAPSSVSHIEAFAQSPTDQLNKLPLSTNCEKRGGLMMLRNCH